jgi:hypothetical protein
MTVRPGLWVYSLDCPLPPLLHTPKMRTEHLFYSRHKEMAPPKYMQLEHKLRNDPRLADYF